MSVTCSLFPLSWVAIKQDENSAPRAHLFFTKTQLCRRAGCEGLKGVNDRNRKDLAGSSQVQPALERTLSPLFLRRGQHFAPFFPRLSLWPARDRASWSECTFAEWHGPSVPFVFIYFIELAQGPKSPSRAVTSGRVRTLSTHGRSGWSQRPEFPREARGSSEDSIFNLGAKPLNVFCSALVRFLVLSLRDAPVHGEGLKLREGWKILQWGD